uniref:Uncharacterized protein n=1 Tax=Parascaris univalens TaxID=6257 RepID=A0A915A0P8_PARUN
MKFVTRSIVTAKRPDGSTNAPACAQMLYCSDTSCEWNSPKTNNNVQNMGAHCLLIELFFMCGVEDGSQVILAQRR